MEHNIVRRVGVFAISAAPAGSAILTAGGTAFAAGIDNARPSDAGNVSTVSKNNDNPGDKGKPVKSARKSTESGPGNDGEKSGADGSCVKFGWEEAELRISTATAVAANASTSNHGDLAPVRPVSGTTLAGGKGDLHTMMMRPRSVS